MTKTMRQCRARGMVVALLATALLLVMVGCSGGSKGNNSATTGAGGSGGGGTTGLGTPDVGLLATATALAQTPTVTPKPGTGGQQGLAEFCAQPPSVATQLPANIPDYPNAELRVSQTSGGNGLYGMCTSDSVSAVASYYAAQLPAKGWRQVQSSSIQNVQQLTASQGNAHLILTIEPDAQLSGTTQIIALTSGLGG